MDSLSLPSHLSLRSTYSARKPGVAVPEFVKLHKGSSKTRYLPQRYRMATANREELNGIEEGDGVIIVDHGSRRKESNLMLNEFVAMFRERTKYPIVEPAHMELAEPSIRDAFSLCVQQGARRVIVSPFFLSPGRHWNQDVVNHRINHCLSHIAGKADECSVCAGTGKCQLRQ
ncbi:sirohydrochlorin ferrochelatase, chloroplastic-like isoform X2 [Lycium barbarum]|uniref:sirohydrochlorin ferrochelatase, chloroplastic-like isoform X2 n=1 Tax=Lycium barbarum TaxID=112863 RepID=UPI00293F4B8D|nr:sirohydrochlorin ferrochelatase, chloroplastic-like isoform X2 [Lycium barbarum]XP_060198332.1 sirohydrochlorin ferrochelatase, chloroplastic-like isoform X2 [Lycium barbarum]